MTHFEENTEGIRENAGFYFIKFYELKNCTLFVYTDGNNEKISLKQITHTNGNSNVCKKNFKFPKHVDLNICQDLKFMNSVLQHLQ